jgi:hypothetical protein
MSKKKKKIGFFFFKTKENKYLNLRKACHDKSIKRFFFQASLHDKKKLFWLNISLKKMFAFNNIIAVDL